MGAKTWFIIAVILLVIVLMMLREDRHFAEQLCEDCEKEGDCDRFCTKLCLKNLYDKITYLSYENETGLYCTCECSSSLKALFRK